MISEWNVFSYLCDICDIDENDKETALRICTTALNSITDRLKPCANKNDSRILSAASALAFYNLCLKNSDSVSSFQAGDIKIGNSYSERLSIAKKMKDEALLEVTPLFEDEGFFAGSVLI